MASVIPSNESEENQPILESENPLQQESEHTLPVLIFERQLKLISVSCLVLTA